MLGRKINLNRLGPLRGNHDSEKSEQAAILAHIVSVPCPKCGSFERRPRGNCATCHRNAGADYIARKKAALGSHTLAEWKLKVTAYMRCPICNREWCNVERPNGQKLPFTKGHIVALANGGGDGIDNVQPECAKCNYARHGAKSSAKKV